MVIVLVAPMSLPAVSFHTIRRPLWRHEVTEVHCSSQLIMASRFCVVPEAPYALGPPSAITNSASCLSQIDLVTVPGLSDALPFGEIFSCAVEDSRPSSSTPRPFEQQVN